MDKGYHGLISAFTNIISIEDLKFILQVDHLIQPCIKIPNEEMNRICGDRIGSESVKEMLDQGRPDLAEMIVSYNPSYANNIIEYYIKKSDIDRMGKYLNMYSDNEMSRVYDFIIRYGNVDDVL